MVGVRLWLITAHAFASTVGLKIRTGSVLSNGRIDNGESCATPSWNVSEWSACEKAPIGSGIASTGVRGRSVKCIPSSAICYTAYCEAATKPAEFDTCSYRNPCLLVFAIRMDPLFESRSE